MQYSRLHSYQPRRKNSKHKRRNAANINFKQFFIAIFAFIGNNYEIKKEYHKTQKGQLWKKRQRF
jgi:hypothetical protein